MHPQTGGLGRSFILPADMQGVTSQDYRRADDINHHGDGHQGQIEPVPVLDGFRLRVSLEMHHICPCRR